MPRYYLIVTSPKHSPIVNQVQSPEEAYAKVQEQVASSSLPARP